MVDINLPEKTEIISFSITTETLQQDAGKMITVCFANLTDEDVKMIIQQMKVKSPQLNKFSFTGSVEFTNKNLILILENVFLLNHECGKSYLVNTFLRFTFKSFGSEFKYFSIIGQAAMRDYAIKKILT